MQELKPVHFESRLNFVHEIFDVFTDFNNSISSYDAHFHVNAFVNTQNCRESQFLTAVATLTTDGYGLGWIRKIISSPQVGIIESFSFENNRGRTVIRFRAVLVMLKNFLVRKEDELGGYSRNT